MVGAAAGRSSLTARVKAGCRVTVDCTAMVWEGAYTIAKPLVATSPSEPLVFTVGARQVADGLDEAVQELRLGDRAFITCTPPLAYGEDGFPPEVPPKVHIIYEVLVKSVVAAGKGEEAATGPKLLLFKTPASAAKAAMEEKFFQMANRSSTRMQITLTTPTKTTGGEGGGEGSEAAASTDELLEQASKMGIR